MDINKLTSLLRDKKYDDSCKEYLTEVLKKINDKLKAGSFKRNSMRHILRDNHLISIDGVTVSIQESLTEYDENLLTAYFLDHGIIIDVSLDEEKRNNQLTFYDAKQVIGVKELKILLFALTYKQDPKIIEIG